MLSLLLVFVAADTTDERRAEVLQAVASYAEPLGLAWDSTASRIAWADLNGDDRPDPIVYLVGRDGCGSGGCTLLVFEAMDEIDAREWGTYRPAAEIALTPQPVTVVPSDGIWCDLVVAGQDRQRRVLRFDGETYAHRPAAGDVWADQAHGTTLFADAR